MRLTRLAGAVAAVAAAAGGWRARRALCAPGAAQRGSTLLDFSDPDVAKDWIAVDDRIMGGSSRSRMVHAGDCTSFEGELVVDGGGFASVRYEMPLALAADVEALVLDASGDGRMGYKLTLNTAPGGRSLSYQCPLPLADGEKRARLPLSSFKASVRGSPAPDAPPLRAAQVCTLGFMLSRYEVGGGVKEAIPPGAFRLQLERLAAE